MSSYIERIEAYNFKSFRKKKTIYFSRGLNVISGPNGSGKSNIGDMLLFVLGTKSIHSVRADKLSDLISKDSGNTCYVIVTFKNDEGKSLEISRRLVIEDEPKSYYYVNGTKARQSDVEDALSAFGINFGTYSFVLQGDINDFVGMSGVERRKLIERIAGTEQFDVELEKARNDIEEVGKNLDILSSMIDIKGQEVEKLRIEKEKKERYDILSKRLRDIRFTELSKAKEANDRSIQAIDRQVDSIEKEIEKSKVLISDLNLRYHSIEQLLSEETKKLNDLTSGEIRTVQEKLRSLEISIASLDSKISEKKLRMQDMAKQEAIDDARREKYEAEAEEIRKSLESERRERDKLQEEFIAAEDEYNKLVAEAQEKEKENATSRVKTKDYQVKISKLNDEINSLKEKLAEINMAIKGKIDRITELEERMEDIGLKVKADEWKLSQNAEDLSKYRDRYYKLKSEYDEIQEKISKLSSQISAAEATARASVPRQIDRASQVEEIKKNISGVVGQIRDLISYGERYAIAVESAASARLNAVVVDTDVTAKRCIEYLREKKISPMTFLPLNKMRAMSNLSEPDILSRDAGFLGFLIDFIDFDDKYRNAVFWVFRDTGLVSDIDAGRRLMGSIRLVSLDGDVFDPSGSITGGFRRQVRQPARSPSEDLDSMKKELAFLQSEKAKIKKELDEALQSMSDASKKTGEIEKERQIINDDLAKNKQILKDIASELSKLKQEIAENKEEKEALEKDISDRQLDLHKYQEALNDIYDDLGQSIIDTIENSMRKLEDYRKKISAITADIEVKEKRVSFLDKESNNIVQQNIELEIQRKAVEDEIHNIEIQKRSMEEELKKHELFLKQLESSHSDIASKIKDMENEMKEIRSKIEEINSDVEIKRSILSELKVKRSVVADRNSAIEAEMQSIPEPTMIEGDIVLEKRKCEADISALGDINNGAIQEYEESVKAYNELKDKKNRLELERRSLQDLTDSLNKKKKEVFVSTFEKINEKMNYVYGTINGGTASLVLKGDDPLESAVEVSVTPKDKATVKIQALSGGEKSIAAMSFITAVQMLMPSSIYFLDEVDMYLDAYNAESMIRLIREKAGEAQTILISLKVSVFEYAANAIGITSRNGESYIFQKDLGEDRKVLGNES